VKGLWKSVPGTPPDRIPLWLDPYPYHGPKSSSQDLDGLAMEKKYLGRNLRQRDRFEMYGKGESPKKPKPDEDQGKKDESGS